MKAGDGISLSGVPVNEGDDIVCVITNTRRTGTITIIKNGVGGAGTFGFTANGATLPGTFNIVTAGSPNSTGQQVFNNVPTGVHVIDESTLPGVDEWDFTSLVCNDPTDNSTVLGDQATINLASGENVTCTYTNTRRGNLRITKSVNWNGATPDPNQKYTICVEGPAPFNVQPDGICRQFTEGEVYTYTNILPGSYTVIETDPTPAQGWVTTITPGSPTVQPGQTAPVLVVNRREQGTLVVTKSVTPSFTRTWNWELEKVVDPEQVVLFDGESTTVQYSVTATRSVPVDTLHRITGTVQIFNNSGLTAVINPKPVDALSTGDPIPLNCGSATFPYSLPGNQSLSCTYDYMTGGPIVATNKVTVTVTNGDIYTGTQPVAFVNPTTKVNETLKVDDTNGKTFTFPGNDPQPYAETYTHDLDCSVLTDASYTNGFGSYTHTNSISSVATETNTTNNSAEVDVDCYRLAVQKTANTAFTRTWEWAIKKTVVPTEVTLFEDESVTLNYSIKVTNTAQNDTGHTVSGVVTVYNPAPNAATLTSLTDLLDGDDVTFANCSAPYVVPAGTVANPGTLTCNYTASRPNANTVTNVATAVLFGKSYPGQATANFANATITKINDSIDVTDTNTTTVFGPFTANATETYSEVANCEAVTYNNGTGSFTLPNIAGIVDLNISSSATAKINCVQYGDITINKTVSDTTPGAWAFDFTLTGAPDPITRTVTNGRQRCVVE